MEKKGVRIGLAAVLLVAFSTRATEEPAAPPQSFWSRRVHLLSDDDRVELRRLVPEADDEVVCKAPCNVVVQFRPSDTFFVDGEGLARSASFQFVPGNGDLTLRASAGSQVARVSGSLLLVGGLAVFEIAGQVYASEKWGFGHVFCDGDPTCVAAHDRTRQTAATVALSGLGVLLLGAVILATHPRTQVATEP